MKDKIKQIKEWFLENAPHLLGTQAERHFSDCIQDLGLSNEWVSVDEMLPSMYECVMVFTSVGEYEYAGYQGGYWDVFSNDHCVSSMITHWKNLPLPPSEAKS